MAADAISLAGRPRLVTVPAAAEIIERFRAALAARDIVPPERILADGRIHRCDAFGKNGKETQLTCFISTAFRPADWKTGATARAGNPGASISGAH